MKLSRRTFSGSLVVLGLLFTACDGGTAATTANQGGDAGGVSAQGGSGGAGEGGAPSSGGMDATGGNGAGGNGTGGDGGSMMAVADPNQDGPYTASAPADKGIPGGMTVRYVFPTAGPTNGPYPVIVLAHGFQLPPSQYDSYLKRLGTFGYVAIAPDFQTSFLGPTNTKNTEDLKAAIDWAAGAAELAGKADTTKCGSTGHSLGGKLSMYLPKLDSRVKAAIAIDPVDGAPGNPIDPNPMCNPPDCIDVSAELPTIMIPTAFLGETLDATAGMFGQACAPAEQNYTTFYSAANPPSLEVTVIGASHMSFLDNPNCGFTCSACATAMVDPTTVSALARAYLVSFFERHLRGNTGYDSYLSGAQAQALYVGTGKATIKSK